MKTVLSELHELSQKKIIEAPYYEFQISGNDHQKQFICKNSN